MKKIIWIVNEYNLPDATVSRQISLCRQLNLHDYDAYIISGSSSNKGLENRITSNEPFIYVETNEVKGYIIRTSDYHRSYERVLVSLQFQHRLWKFRDKLPKPDVIVSDFAGLFGGIFLKWKKKYGVRVIYDILDLWPESFVTLGYLKRNSLLARFLYKMEHKSYREADGIIFSMQGGRNYIIDKGWSKEVGGDVDTSNIGYLNNGIDIEIADKQKDEFVLDDSDLNTDEFKVIYLGSISATNGLDVLVETAKVLQERAAENIVILIYGYGTQEEHLKKMVENYGLTNIKFKGKLEKKYAMSLLTKSDLNIFTFTDSPLWKYGVSPNKLFTYFASGKPILSVIKPAYDLVEGKKAGISIKNDPVIVADTIQKFYEMERKEYLSYCQNARKTAEEYDYRNLVNVLIKQIEGMN